MTKLASVSLYSSTDTRSYMIEFIRENFGDVLGPHMALLDKPGGLDLLSEMVRSGELGPRSRAA